MNQTVSQAAVYLRVSTKTVKALCRARKLQAVKRRGRWMITPPSTEHLFTVRSLADSMNKSVRIIQGYIKTGTIEAIRIGRVWRIPIDEGTKLMRINLGIDNDSKN
jgi:excisionase family DNA binding protein